MVILYQSGPGTTRFNPDFSAMTTGHSDGVVDGLVVLEIGLEDDVESAQLNDVVVFGPTDGCSERAEAGVEPGPSQLCSAGLLS